MTHLSGHLGILESWIKGSDQQVWVIGKHIRGGRDVRGSKAEYEGRRIFFDFLIRSNGTAPTHSGALQ